MNSMFEGSQLRKYIPGITVTTLFIITMLMLPRIDYIEPSVFFYVKNLPIIYHASVVVSILVAIFGEHKMTRILSVCLFALLIVWTPSIMLVQTWHLDSYPFLAEAVYLTKNIHLSKFHYIMESPILSLTFGPYLSITGLNPFTLSKIYPGFIIILYVLSIYLIAKNLNMKDKALFAAPILFVSVIWPQIFHISRFGFSLFSYLMTFLLLTKLIYQKSEYETLTLLILQVIILSVSHPVTPIYFIINLFSIIVFDMITQKFYLREYNTLFTILIICTTLWLLWNTIGIDPKIIVTFKDLSDKFISSIFSQLSEVAGVERVLAGRTQLYTIIMYVRLIFTGVVYLAIFMIPILFFRQTEGKLLTFLMGWSWSNLLTSIPMLYAGLPYFQKPVTFTFISWSFIGASVLGGKSSSFMRRIGGWALIGFLIASSLIMPLIKYGPLPTEYPSSKELALKYFLDSYGSSNHTYINFEDPAYYYSYIAYGQIEQAKVESVFPFYIDGVGLNQSIIEQSSFCVMSRTIFRDALQTYSPSWLDVIEETTRTLPMTTHNKVYDSGWPEMILTPRFEP